VARAAAAVVAGLKAAVRAEAAVVRGVPAVEAAQGQGAEVEAQVVHEEVALWAAVEPLVAREAWASESQEATATVGAVEEHLVDGLAAPMASGSWVAAATAAGFRASAAVDLPAGTPVAVAQAWARRVVAVAMEETASERWAVGTEAVGGEAANEGQAPTAATGTSVEVKAETAEADPGAAHQARGASVVKARVAEAAAETRSPSGGPRRYLLRACCPVFLATCSVRGCRRRSHSGKSTAAGPDYAVRSRLHQALRNRAADPARGRALPNGQAVLDSRS